MTTAVDDVVSDTGPTIPALEEQRSFYNAWNVRHRWAGFDGIEDESKARGLAVLNAVGRLGLASPSILEVGCGTGWLTEKLAEVGECTGIDLADQAIDIARVRVSSATLIAADFLSYAIPASSFDIGICVETISYVSDQGLLVHKLADAIKPDGFLVLTSVNKFVYMRRSDVAPPAKGQIRKWLRRRELVRLIQVRFDIVDMTTIVPKGDRGVLRITESYGVNAVLNGLLGKTRVARAKEMLGLGHCRILVAKRRH